MKIGTTSYEPCVRFGWEKGLALIKESGFDCVDLSFEKEVMDAIGTDFRTWATEMRAYLDDIGLECHQAHAPCNTVLYGDKFDESHPGFMDVVNSMETASILGAKYIVVHAVAVPPEHDPSEAVELNIRYYQALLPYCEKFNIRVGIENLYIYCRFRDRYISLLDTPWEMLAVYEGVNSPWVTVCVDLGHTSFLDYHAQDFIRALGKGVIGLLHMHDTNLREDSHLLPYTCKMNYPAIIEALKEVEFDGVLSFEIPYFFLNMPDELLFDAHAFAAKVGRYMAAQLEG